MIKSEYADEYVSKMTCQEARDWLAYDDGFMYKKSKNVSFSHWQDPNGNPILDVECNFVHPYEPVLERAIRAIPPHCAWGKSPNDGTWYLDHKYWGCIGISDNFGCKNPDFDENDSGYLYRLIVAMRMKIKDKPNNNEKTMEEFERNKIAKRKNS